MGFFVLLRPIFIRPSLVPSESPILFVLSQHHVSLALFPSHIVLRLFITAQQVVAVFYRNQAALDPVCRRFLFLCALALSCVLQVAFTSVHLPYAYRPSSKAEH